MNNNNSTWTTEKHAECILQLPASYLRKSVESGSLKDVIKHMRLRTYKYLYNRVDLENYIYENPDLTGL